MYVTRAVLPGMVERNEGHVINIGSTAGSYPYPGGNIYGATKGTRGGATAGPRHADHVDAARTAFVAQFSLNLRADLQGKRVRVTNIEPGLVAGTEFSNVRFHGDADRGPSQRPGPLCNDRDGPGAHTEAL